MFLYIRETKKKRAIMANVNLGQLNKPGFKTSLGSKSGGSRIVANNLKSARNTSLFSNIRVSGQWGTVNLNKANYQNARLSLNAGKGAPPRMSGAYAPSSSHVATNYNIQNGSNAYTAGQVVGTTLSMAMGILNQTGVMDKLVSKITHTGSTSASNQLSQGVESLGKQGASLGTSNSDIAQTISGMSACSDSQSLSFAIDSAQDQLSAMDAQTETFETAKSDAETKKSDLGAKLKTAGNEKAQAKSQVSKGSQAVNSAKMGKEQAMNKVKTGNEQYDNALSKYSEALDKQTDAKNNQTRAQSTLSRANDAYSQAQADTRDAQAAYDNEPEYIEGKDGAKMPNPKKQIAKTKLEQAKIAEKNALDAKNKAEENLKTANKAVEDADKAVNDAKAKKDEAKENLGELKSKAEEAEKTLETEQQKLDDVKANLEKAEENFDITEQNYQELETQMSAQDGIIELFKNHKTDMKVLSDAISEQQKRCESLKKSEQKAGKDWGHADQNAEFKEALLSGEVGNETTLLSDGQYVDQSGNQLSEADFKSMEKKAADASKTHTPEGTQMKQVEIKGYSNETLSNMDLEDLKNLRDQYAANNDTGNMDRIDRFIAQKEQQE